MYSTEVDTRDELPDFIMDVIASIRERPDALRKNNTLCPHASCKVHWC